MVKELLINYNLVWFWLYKSEYVPTLLKEDALENENKSVHSISNRQNDEMLSMSGILIFSYGFV